MILARLFHPKNGRHQQLGRALNFGILHQLLSGVAGFFALTLAPLPGDVALGLPAAPQVFCDTYPQAPACKDTTVGCTQCHSGPPVLNKYGESILSILKENAAYTKVNFRDFAPAAILDAGALDADGDGVASQDEIAQGTEPFNAESVRKSGVAGLSRENPFYKVGGYDEAMAYKRVMLTYCAYPPSYEEMEAFKQSTDKKARIHAALKTCLASDYWLKEALPKLADSRVRPIKAVGLEGNVTLADYKWDYRLFAYVLSGDRDARDLLLAKYHINAQGERVEGTIGPQEFPQVGRRIVLGSGQPLPSERRAGMLTTQWFLASNTMFSPLPRTTAAQAYRAYLGMDIARGEGLEHPIPQEPRDVDNKGVKELACASCHATLDPLSYSFSPYNGIIANATGLIFNLNGQYNANRTAWSPNGHLLGKPVANLLAWAESAANSDAFKKNLAKMFFTQALGRAPLPHEQDEFKSLWESLPAENFSANRLIQRLVDTQSFGGLPE